MLKLLLNSSSENIIYFPRTMKMPPYIKEEQIQRKSKMDFHSQSLNNPPKLLCPSHQKPHRQRALAATLAVSPSEAPPVSGVARTARAPRKPLSMPATPDPMPKRTVLQPAAGSGAGDIPLWKKSILEYAPWSRPTYVPIETLVRNDQVTVVKGGRCRIDFAERIPQLCSLVNGLEEFHLSVAADLGGVRVRVIFVVSEALTAIVDLSQLAICCVYLFDKPAVIFSYGMSVTDRVVFSWLMVRAETTCGTVEQV
jgi:hypothetical protein